MSRLTKVYPNGNITLDASQFPSVTQETIDSEINKSIVFSEAVKKLVKYEDKEMGATPWQNAAEEHAASIREIVVLYQENIAPITSIVLQSISDWLNDMDVDVIKWAIVEAAKHNKRSWKYIEGILKNHFNAGRTTLAAVEASSSGYKARQQDSESVYSDSGVDYDELEKLMREKM